MYKKVVIVSGYFNPVHKGHIEYFNNARACGDELCVIVNSDLQRELKGSKEFMKQEERLFIVENLRMVDHAVMSVDQDRTVCETIRLIHDSFKSKDSETVLAFANGGDQNNDTIPERPVCEELGVELIDNMGDKIQSSSWLLNKQ
jgi:cytidyltransferase-like protein